MIVLRGELDDPKPLARGRGNRAADRGKNPVAAQAAHHIRRAQRHVDGMGSLVGQAPPVGDAWPPTRRTFAAGTVPSTAPHGTDRQRELRIVYGALPARR